jgi:SAM-dependent methyltransferase
MTPEILTWLKSAKERFAPTPGSVLEVGSYDVNGSPRSVFGQATEYLGIDRQEGPGVDLVADAATLDLGQKFGVVLCCETLEHTADPLRIVERLKSHVAPGGILIVTTPGNGFGEHFFPRDYYRFMPNFYEDILFDGMEILEIAQVRGKDEAGPSMCGIARMPTE